MQEHNVVMWHNKVLLFKVFCESCRCHFVFIQFFFSNKLFLGMTWRQHVFWRFITPARLQNVMPLKTAIHVNVTPVVPVLLLIVTSTSCCHSLTNTVHCTVPTGIQDPNLKLMLLAWLFLLLVNCYMFCLYISHRKIIHSWHTVVF